VKAFADAFEGAATAPVEVSATTIASQHSMLDAGVRVQATSRRRLGVGVALVGVTLVGVTTVLAVRRAPPKAIEAPVTAVPAAETRPPATPVVPQPTVVPKAPAPVPVVTTTSREPPQHEPARPNRQLKKVSVKPAPASPGPQPTNCNPDYYFDAQGDKHFRPECFLEKKAGP
jgi:hypothetical protein